MKTISISEAKAQGLTRYYTGKPCKYGHIAERNVATRYCCECNRIAYRKHYKQNSEKVLTRQRSNGASHRQTCKGYGLTEQAYAEMLNQQGGTCAICKVEPGGKRLAIDHCHESGKVRGLLCQECNHGLGKFRDSLSLLERAHGYLTRSGAFQD